MRVIKLVDFKLENTLEIAAEARATSRAYIIFSALSSVGISLSTFFNNVYQMTSSIPQMGFDPKRKRQPNLRGDPPPSLERSPTVEVEVMDDGEHERIEQEEGSHQSEHKQNHPQMVAEESMPLPTTDVVLASLRRVIPPSAAALLRRLLPHPERSSRRWLSLLPPSR